MSQVKQAESRHIILASQSPRRQQLLTELGFSFEVRVIDYDETYPENLKGEQIAEYVASSKAGRFRSDLKDDDILKLPTQ